MDIKEFHNLVCQIHSSCVKMAQWVRSGLPVNQSDTRTLLPSYNFAFPFTLGTVKHRTERLSRAYALQVCP